MTHSFRSNTLEHKKMNCGRYMKGNWTPLPPQSYVKKKNTVIVTVVAPGMRGD